MRRGTGYVNNARGFANRVCPDGVKLGVGDERARLVCYHSAKITPAKRENSLGDILTQQEQ